MDGMADDARNVLQRLMAERGEDFANLSRVIGRNPAYLQQFVRRGSPRRLAEEDRRTLARYLRVDEAVLGGPPSPRAPREAVRVPRLDVRASAGPGAIPDERGGGHLLLDARTARELGQGGALHAIRVVGDSMLPTLGDGDDILVDRADGPDRLRDGVYVLRREEALSVKRLVLGPSKGKATLVSDNPQYPSLPDVPLAELDIIGRVVWVGRRLR